MKSQALSMQVIVVVILAMLALAAVLFFFFGSAGKGVGGVNTQQDFAKCKVLCAQIVAESETSDDCETKANDLKYCDSCAGYHCSKEGVWTDIDCSAGSAVCTT